jgi:hypothetical protein
LNAPGEHDLDGLGARRVEMPRGNALAGDGIRITPEKSVMEILN